MNTKSPFTAPLGETGVETVSTPLVEAALAAHRFLKGMSPHQCRILTDCATLSHFEPGETVIRAGDPADRFYLIIKGRVVLESLQGSELKPLQTISDGDVLGWSWLFPPYYWHFDARAVEPTDVIFLSCMPLREECEADHDLGYELLKRISEVVVNRLQGLRRQMLDSNG